MADPIIGAWLVPISKMAQWKAVGINTFVHFESEGNTISQANWRAAATALDINYIDRPSLNLSDETDPRLIAYLQHDEPDFHQWPLSGNCGRDRFGVTIDCWKDMYVRLRNAGAKKPIFGNFSGPHVTAAFPWYDGKGNSNWAGHRAFVPYADWIGEDWYPINKNTPRYWDSMIPHATLQLRAHDLLSKWSGNKPMLHFIGVCDLCLNNTGLGRGPTVDEMKEQVRAVMKRGSKGVIFFVTRGGVRPENCDRPHSRGFTFDCTDAAMRVGMTQIINEINTGYPGGGPPPGGGGDPPPPPPPPPPLPTKKKLYIGYEDFTWDEV